MVHQFTVVVERDRETGLYVGTVPGLPGAHTQAASLDELQKNMKEVVALCLEEAAPFGDPDIPDFVGTQMIEVRV
jgi:predicted RNase H-like HicB family nuclease